MKVKSFWAYLPLMLTVGLLCCALSACSADDEPGGQGKIVGGYTFTDSLGREVTVDEPQRVVALMQSFAEVWLLAGGADSLVGVTDDAAADLALSPDVAVVGTFMQPNLEAVLALSPDLVLLSAENSRTDSHLALLETLDAANIPAAYFGVTHFEDYLQMLEICTQITGSTAAYQQNGLDVQTHIKQIIAEDKRLDAPTVLFCITYSGGVRAQNSATMTGKMLQDLGCRNIVDDYPALLQDFSMEKVVEVDPDYIFVIPMGNTSAAAEKALQDTLTADPVWASLSAVQGGRYFILPQELFLYKPNENWGESYAYLADLLAEK